MKRNIDKDLINIAPGFSRHRLYFSELQKFFHEWSHQEFRDIEKKYGRDRVEKIISGNFPPSEEVEKAEVQKLKGKEKEKYEEEAFESLICLFDLHDVAAHNVAFYYSFFIYLLSDFENKMNELCWECGDKNHTGIDLRDLKGSGIERSLLFLDKVVQIELPDSSLIKEIILMRDIRNVLAHSSGYTSDSGLIRRIQSNRHVEIKGEENGEEDRILFAEEYPEYCIRQMEKFFNQLAKKNQRIFHRLFR